MYIKECFRFEYLNEKQEKYLHIFHDICKTYKAIISTYKEDQFCPSFFFLPEISIIMQTFTELEGSDFKDAAVEAKRKIKELSKTHDYFGNTIASVAVLLNPQIENYSLLLSSDKIKAAKKIIKNKMSKYTLPNQNLDMNITETQSSSQRIEHFKKRQDENGTKKRNSKCTFASFASMIHRPES